VKNPQTFATLIQKDPEAIVGLRMTRSRLKELERYFVEININLNFNIGSQKLMFQ
jgi:hypothetical protein